VSILVNRDPRVLVQGITGREGSFHTRQMVDYGTRIVGGVTPGKGGQSLDGLPVFDDVASAREATHADASIIYVPARFAGDAIIEAAAAGMALIVCISEGIPVWDMIRVSRFIEGKDVRLIGPNCPGIITPAETKIGIMPGHIHAPGSVGVVSRSGTLTYKVVWALTRAGICQSTCLGIGGDPIVGTDFVAALSLFQADEATEAIVMIGEIGGSAEERAAELIATTIRKPVVAFIAGLTAPRDRRMGHAGAIVSGGSGRAADKAAAWRSAGVMVADYPAQIADILTDQGFGES